ncbi:hypothetical protein, partial [Pseudomonas aeruginosa]|uniref:hypothetical protein n=1 Tax=Pseudomonas aeruginosa TaxID=287 RepID=UPI0019552FFB
KNSEVCSRPEIRGYFRPSLGSGNMTLGVLEQPTITTNSKVPTHPFTEKSIDMKTPYLFSGSPAHVVRQRHPSLAC